MRTPGAAGLLALGILLLWAALTGRLNCITDAFRCLVTGDRSASGSLDAPGGWDGVQPISLPSLPTLGFPGVRRT